MTHLGGIGRLGVWDLGGNDVCMYIDILIPVFLNGEREM